MYMSRRYLWSLVNPVSKTHRGHTSTSVFSLNTTLFCFNPRQTTDLYNVPYTVRPIYFLSDREDSHAQFSLPLKVAETWVDAFV